jgi:hypothetical protein
VLAADGGAGGVKGGAPLVTLHEVGKRRAVHERRRRQQNEDVDPAQVLCTVGCTSGHVTWRATKVQANALRQYQAGKSRCTECRLAP